MEGAYHCPAGTERFALVAMRGASARGTRRVAGVRRPDRLCRADRRGKPSGQPEALRPTGARPRRAGSVAFRDLPAIALPLGATTGLRRARREHVSEKLCVAYKRRLGKDARMKSLNDSASSLQRAFQKASAERTDQSELSVGTHWLRNTLGLTVARYSAGS